MILVSTPAIILSTLRYGETSKIVRLATRDHGVQSAIAKGALRPKSRFGAALQVLSGGQAHILLADRRDLHTLTGFDLVTLPVRLTQDVARYATATALAEVTLRVAPAAPHPEAFDVLEDALSGLAEAAPRDLPALALRVLWRLITTLGFAPVLATCVRDDRELPRGDVAFSAPEGGTLCDSCARDAETLRLPEDALTALQRLIEGAGPLPELDSRNAAAHRRLVARYLRHHLAEGAALPALDFWQMHAWAGK
jgi:DNA repair protein RecO (recombination protein O)